MLRGRASMAYINVAIINASTVLRDSVVKAAVPDLQTQVHRDFAPAWGIDADLTFVPKGSKPAPGSWWLVILDNSDVADGPARCAYAATGRAPCGCQRGPARSAAGAPAVSA